MKYYRDLENEKFIGDIITTDDLFEEYVELCRDGSIDPTETAFSDFLFNAQSNHGGTLVEVDFDKRTSYFFTTEQDSVMCLNIPSVYSYEEVKEMMMVKFYADHLSLADTVVYVCNNLHGTYSVSGKYIGHFSGSSKEE